MEGTIAEVRLFAGNFAPRAWALCYGQLLSINQNQALFSLLGTTYGGDGRTTFGLPDLRGRAPIGVGTGPGLTPRNLGQRSGAEYTNLGVSNLPAHTHAAAMTGETLTGVISATATVTPQAVNDEGGEETASGNHLSNTASGQGIYSSDGSPLVDMASYEAPVSGNVSLTGVSGNVTVGLTGHNQSVNLMQPYMGMNYIICLQGVYPSRS